MSRGEFNLRQGGLLTRLGLVSILISGFVLAIGVIGFVFAGAWWGLARFAGDLSPGSLAFYSILIGPAPLLLSLLASIVARALGGTVDAREARHCFF